MISPIQSLDELLSKIQATFFMDPKFATLYDYLDSKNVVSISIHGECKSLCVEFLDQNR